MPMRILLEAISSHRDAVGLENVFHICEEPQRELPYKVNEG